MSTIQEDFVATSRGTPADIADAFACREHAVEEARRALKRVYEVTHHKGRKACLAGLAAIDAALAAVDSPKEKGKIVFALTPETSDMPRTVIVGVTRGAWEHMAGGNTTHFDLSAMGVPLQFMVFGCDSVEAGRALLEAGFAARGVPVLDARREDFSGALGKMQGRGGGT